MNISLLLFWVFFVTGSTDVPNYYPSYSTARHTALNQQKELLVFFKKSDCANCDAAWNSFGKDSRATQKYISTSLDVDDFDGGVIYKLYELPDVPGWIILSPEGHIVEKWSGGWKDVNGKPEVYAQKAKTQETNRVDAKPAATPSIGEKTNLASSPATPVENPVVASKQVNNSEEVSSTESKNIKSGYVLQAGYFGSEPNAQKLVLDLKNKGYDSFHVLKEMKNGTPYFRVISSNFSTEAEAMNHLRKLETAGIRVTLKPGNEL